MSLTPREVGLVNLFDFGSVKVLTILLQLNVTISLFEVINYFTLTATQCSEFSLGIGEGMTCKRVKTGKKSKTGR